MQINDWMERDTSVRGRLRIQLVTLMTACARVIGCYSRAGDKMFHTVWYSVFRRRPFVDDKLVWTHKTHGSVPMSASGPLGLDQRFGPD